MLTEADEVSIRRLHDAWLEAEQRGHVEAVLGLCTEDVEWLPPDGPSIFGRAGGGDLLVTPAIRLLSIQVTNFVLDGAEGRAIKTWKAASHVGQTGSRSGQDGDTRTRFEDPALPPS